MLVSFSIANYRSFAGEQTLSLVAGASAKKQERFAFPTSNALAPHLLHAAAIFGANASGKTSLIKALDFFQDFVVFSARESQEGEPIKTEPHLFKAGLAEQPSEFEIIFIHQENLYQYGFAVDKERVWSEWLFVKPNTDKSRMRTLFHRAFDKDKNEYEWIINQTWVKGRTRLWKQSTRANALFLSQAVQLNAKAFKEPFSWIRNDLKIIESVSRLHKGFTLRQCVERGWKDKVLQLLQSVDISIHDIQIETEEIDPSDIARDMPVFMKEAFLKKVQKEKVQAFNVSSLHQGEEGALIPLDFDEESDGTKVLFSLAGPWFDVLEHGRTLVVDELHNSLHPRVLKVLVDLFHDPKINTKNAQLVFTSHETSIIDESFMHQDQIWLAEKGKYGSTALIPLSDFKVRDTHNFQKPYLHGRYGGIPKIQELTIAK